VPILKNDGVKVNGKDDNPYMKWKTYQKRWKDPPCSMGNSTISMAIFYVANCNKLPEGMMATQKIPRTMQENY